MAEPVPVGTSVTVEVPATSANLGPGFDCFGLALSWREQVELTVAEGSAVQVTGEGADTLPRDESHLVLRCALSGLADLGRAVPGLRLRAHNTIPHGRGLGSSSAAIVAGLLGAAALAGWEENPDRRRWTLRHADAVEGHPDNVAAAVQGGFAISWRTASGARAVTRPVHPDVRATVYVPDAPLATVAARRLLPQVVPHAEAAQNTARAALLVHALGDEPDLLAEATRDWLHTGYRRPAMPGSVALVEGLREQGRAAVVSGAGPTVLVLGRATELAELPATPAGFRRVDVGIGAGASARVAGPG